jgi:thioredoxin 2
MAAGVVECPSCGTRNRVPAVASGVPRCASCKASLPWVVDATDADFDTVAATSTAVMVDLWAAWCGPCRMVAPVLQQLAATHAGHLKVIKVDVDANPLLASRFAAQSIPLILIMKDGEVRERITGAKPLPVLAAALRRHL